MSFRWPFRKSRCVFCFNKFHLDAAPSRPLSPIGPMEPDTGIGDFLNVPAPEMRRLEQPPNGSLADRLLRRVWLPHDPEWKRVCPRCHMCLPQKMASGELDGQILAIVGARGAGKSNYLGVLLNALEKRYAAEVGFSMFAEDTFSVERMEPVSSRMLYEQRYGSSLFSGQPTALESTPSAATNPDILIPLIYRMQFPLQPWEWIRRPFSHFKALDLVIFDAAGEDLQKTLMRQQFMRYVAAASGIIILLDPLALPGIAELLAPSVRSRLPQAGDTREVIQGVINLLEQRNGLRADQKIPIPVAVAFTKSDMMKGIVKPDSAILRDSCHEGGFNASDSEKCSNEVVDYLNKWGCGDIYKVVTDRFEQAQFFAVSALGALPPLTSITSRRLADPLLWLLWNRGYIPSRPD